MIAIPAPSRDDCNSGTVKRASCFRVVVPTADMLDIGCDSSYIAHRYRECLVCFGIYVQTLSENQKEKGGPQCCEPFDGDAFGCIASGGPEEAPQSNNLRRSLCHCSKIPTTAWAPAETRPAFPRGNRCTSIVVESYLRRAHTYARMASGFRRVRESREKSCSMYQAKCIFL
jgi:hypothetical protein